MLTTDAINQRFADVMKPKFDPAELRLSESLGCPRKRAYLALGYEPRQDSNLAGIFEAGHVWEEWLVEKVLMPLYPDAVQQVEVATPYGASGHMDLWIPSERKIIECKCVRIGARAYGLPKEEHLRQVMAYLHFYDPGASAELVYLFREDPSQHEEYPVLYSSEVGQAIEDELCALRGMIDSGALPDRPYNNPSAFPCFYSTKDYDSYCPFHEYCWGGEGGSMAAPPVNAPEADDLAREYLEVHDQRKDLKEILDSLEDRKKDLEARFAPHYSDGAKTIHAGGAAITRSLIPGRSSYAMEKAFAAGAADRDALEPFRSEGESYYRFSVKRI